MSLHSRIREARNNKGITQIELAESLGVAKTTVAGWEKNREPTAAQIGAIADVLDSSVSFLLQDEVSARSKEKQPTENGKLSEREVALIHSMQGLSPNERELALDLCSALVLELLRHHKVAVEKQAAVPAVSSR